MLLIGTGLAGGRPRFPEDRRLSCGLLLALTALAASSLQAQPSSAGAERPLGVSGALVEEGGAPAVGVEVVLRPFPNRFEQDLHVLGVPDALPAAVDRTRTGADGRFIVAAPVPGPYRLELRPPAPADPPGTVLPIVYRILAPLTAAQVLEPTELPRRHRIAVRVLDAGSQPIEGALVIAAPTATRSPRRKQSAAREQPSRLYPRFHRGAARTDEEGVARFLMPTANAGVATAVPGFVVATAQTESGRAVLRLKRHPGFVVRVRDPNDRPAPYVLIRKRGAHGLPLGLTDEQGEVLVNGLVSTDGRIGFKIGFERGEHGLASVSLLSADGLSADGEGVLKVRLEAPLRLPGRVTDSASGLPVDTATVWASASPGHAVSTDRAGAFELNLQPNRRQTHLWVTAAGYVSARVSADEESGPTDLAVHLQPAAALSGVVEDEAGEPVAGAAIRAQPLALRAFDRMSGPPLQAASDARGLFVLTEAEFDRPYRLEVRAPGFPVTVVDAPPVERGTTPAPLQIVLGEGRRTSGTVVDTEDRPVAGAEVSLLRPADTGRSELERLYLDRLGIVEPTTTDEHGRFSFPAVQTGEVEVRIVHAEYLSPGDRRVDVPRGERDHDLGSFTLVGGAEILGVVVDPEEQPVAGATVQTAAAGADREPERTTTTELDGTFRLGGLPDDLVDLKVRAAGFAPLRLPGVRPVTEQPVRIKLQTGATLAGLVVDAAGDPVAGASVHVRPEWRTFSTPPERLHDPFERTGDDGRFRFENVAAGVWSLKATAGDAKAVLDALRLENGTERTVELRFGAVHQLTVTVTNALVEPLADADVQVTREEDLMSTNYETTDVSGQARIAFTTPGAVTVRVDHEHYLASSSRMVLEPGHQELAIRLSSGGVISGTIRSAEGAPIAAATVVAGPETDYDTQVRMPYGIDDARAVSNRRGEFRIAGLEPGTYALVGHAAGFAADGPARRFDIDGQEAVNGVEIVLRPGGSIVGVVRGLDTMELGRMRIDAFRDGHLQSTTPDAEGRFALRHLAPGTWDVIARSEGRSSGRSIRRSVTLRPGDSEAFVELPFERGLRLSGQVLVAGAPLIGGRLDVSTTEPMGGRWAETDQRGGFDFAGLEPGTLHLRILQPNGRRDHVPIDLQSHQEGLRIDLEASTALSGVVLDATSRQPLADAWLAAGSAPLIVVLRRQMAALYTAMHSGTLSPDDAVGLEDTAATLAGQAGTIGDGRFVIEFGPGAEQLLVARQGYRDIVLPLNAAPGSHSPGIVIELQPAAAEAPDR